MARSQNGNAANYMTQLTYTGPTSTPLSMACWFNPANVTNFYILMTINDFSDAGGLSNFYLGADGSGSDQITAGTENTTSNGNAGTSTSYTANAWHHACGVWTSSTSRAAFLNGGGKGTNATNITPAGIDTCSVGCFNFTGGVGSALNGLIAEAAIWNAALSDAEVLSLSKGASPLLVRPGSIRAYWPLYGRVSPEPDIVGNFHQTITGTVSQAGHYPGILTFIGPRY